MSNGITFGGLSSGIDTEGIIAKLIALEGKASSRLQGRQRTLDNKALVFNQLLERISGVAQAAGRLNSAAAFNPVSATSSDSAVAAIVGTPGAAAGNYALNVTKLAQAEKIASAPQASITDALGKSGTILVNGKGVTIAATDSLRSIAEKINGLGSGVTASLIDGGAGSAYLTLSSGKTGASNGVSVADASGSVLADLGILSNTDVAPIGTQSRTFTSGTTPLSTLLGVTLPPTSFTVNGASIAVDYASDTLQSLAEKINASGTGAGASVESVTVEGGTQYRLKLTGVTDQTDAGGALHALGILKRSAANGLVEAQDAAYSLDGVALTSDKNAVSGAIPGATLTLLKVGTSTLNLTRDTGAIKGQVNQFVQSANAALQYVKDASVFDKDNFGTGPLFGDPSARQFVATFSDSLFQNSGPAGAKYRNLASIGFSLDKAGLVQVDDARFDAAMADRPDEVRTLFQATGTTTAPGLSYVSSTNKTLSSVGGGYEVAITRLATKSSYVGAVANTAPSTSEETLTFSGAAFGTATIGLTLETGSTAASIVAKVNADPRLKESVVASLDQDGKLRFESRKFGSGGKFDVVSNISAASTNSGVGIGGQGTKTDGVDIAGTIGGGAATGFGQFLTGDATNGPAAGLQVMYTGTQIGTVGSLAFSRGLSGLLQTTLATFNDSTNGLVVQAQKSLQDGSSSINDQIARNKVALDRKEAELRQKFAKMEQAISRLQAQGQKLSGLNNNNKS